MKNLLIALCSVTSLGCSQYKSINPKSRDIFLGKTLKPSTNPATRVSSRLTSQTARSGSSSFTKTSPSPKL